MGDESYDADVMRSEIAKIREKLKRLDQERQATAAELDKVLQRANRRLPEEQRPPETAA